MNDARAGHCSPSGTRRESRAPHCAGHPKLHSPSVAGSPDPETNPSEAAGEPEVEETWAAVFLCAGRPVRALHDLFHHVLCLPPPEVTQWQPHKSAR